MAQERIAKACIGGHRQDRMGEHGFGVHGSGAAGAHLRGLAGIGEDRQATQHTGRSAEDRSGATGKAE